MHQMTSILRSARRTEQYPPLLQLCAMADDRSTGAPREVVVRSDRSTSILCYTYTGQALPVRIPTAHHDQARRNHCRQDACAKYSFPVKPFRGRAGNESPQAKCRITPPPPHTSILFAFVAYTPLSFSQQRSSQLSQSTKCCSAVVF